MYQHPSVRANLEKVASYGNVVLDAETGELASGLSGQGRMMEPEHILERVLHFFTAKKEFDGKKVLIALNDGSTTLRFNIKFKGSNANTSLPAGAVATYVW